MAITTWENLPKNPLDPQTIEQAVDAGIAAHEADPDAHLGEGEALENHRENEVLDHPAESVVNDKISIYARQFIAIVDPATPDDFDTIESALDYAITKGGGTIFITPGTHYIANDIVIPANINLYGSDRDTTTVVTDDSGAGVIKLEDGGGVPIPVQNFEGLTFDSDSGYSIQNETAGSGADITLRLIDCNFIGNGCYLDANVLAIEFTDCNLTMNTTAGIVFEGALFIDNCRLSAGNSSGTTVMFGTTGDGYYDSFYSAVNSSFSGAFFGTGGQLLPSFPEIDTIESCEFIAMVATTFSGVIIRLVNNNFNFYSTGYLSLGVDDCIITGNKFTSGTGNRLRLPSGADRNIVTSNSVRTAITNSGTGNIVADNVVS